jgi:hypothetical protein
VREFAVADEGDAAHRPNRGRLDASLGRTRLRRWRLSGFDR